MKNTTTILWLFCICSLCSCQYLLPNELVREERNEENRKGTKAIHVVNNSNILLKNCTVESEKSVSQKTLTFNVKKQAETLLLHWTIKKNNQTKAFVLERSSDGESYEVLTTIADNLEGNFKHYSYIDVFPLKGIAHYRLRQIYQDGTEFLSQPEQIELNVTTEEWAVITKLDKEDYFHLKLNPRQIKLPIQVVLLNGVGEKLYSKNYNQLELNLKHPFYAISSMLILKITTFDNKVFTKQVNW